MSCTSKKGFLMDDHNKSVERKSPGTLPDCGILSVVFAIFFALEAYVIWQTTPDSSAMISFGVIGALTLCIAGYLFAKKADSTGLALALALVGCISGVFMHILLVS